MRKLLIAFFFIGLISSCNDSAKDDESRAANISSPRSDKWWIDRHNEINARDKTNISVVFIGDSITQRWEDIETGLPIWEQTFTDEDTLNLGFNGDKTENVLWRIENGELDGITPVVTFLLIGTNNAELDNGEELAKGILKIIDQILLKTPNTLLVVHRIFPRGEPESYLRIRTDKASEIVKNSIHSDNIVYLDINEHFMDAEFHISPDIMLDKLHLTTKGYQIWFDALFPYLYP